MKKNVYLVAGHGQGDPGAIGNGSKEADLTREFVSLLANHLNWNMGTISVYDFSKDLYQNQNYGIFNKTNEYNETSEFIEFHFNSASPQAKGTEVLIPSGTNADAIDNAILRVLSKYFQNRGIKKRSDLANINAMYRKGISARLVEICFISNAEDMAIYQANKEQIARDMAIALRPLIGFEEPPKPPAPKPKPDFQENFKYRVHIENLGWSSWKKGNEVAGTIGQGLRIEAIQFDTKYNLDVKANIQNKGIVEYKNVNKDTIIGTIGQGLRLEALFLKANGIEIYGQSHIENLGWEPEKKLNELISLGTIGQGLRIEALRFRIK